MSFLGNLHLIDPAEMKKVKPVMEGIEATTMTGQQRELIDGIIHETAGKERAPGLPGKHAGDKVPTLRASPTATLRPLGAIHLRGTK